MFTVAIPPNPLTPPAWLAWATTRGEIRSRMLRLDGDREAVRRASVVAALEGVIELAGG